MLPHDHDTGLKARITSVVMAGSLLWAGCGRKSSSPGASAVAMEPPVAQPAMIAWQEGGKSKALSDFVEAAWRVGEDCAMTFRPFTLIALGSLMISAGVVVQAEEHQATRPPTLPDDPDKAWAEVGKVHEALRPPNDWATHKPIPEEVAKFQTQVR